MHSHITGAVRKGRLFFLPVRYRLSAAKDKGEQTIAHPYSLSEGLVALHFLRHASHVLGDVEFCTVCGLHCGGLDNLTIHGGNAIAFLFAASQACYHGNNSYDS